MFDDETFRAAQASAARLKLEPAALLAVAHIESGGRAFAMVAGKREPLVRFEGHYFHQRLSGAAREQAVREGLASPRAGAVKNPNGQAARWALINRAIEIDAQAALESVSYGVGQVMGAHWQWLGFSSIAELVNLARRSIAGQFELMERFIAKSGLAGALRTRNWTAFARGYNGPAYARNAYHTKLAAAYRRFGGKEAAPAADGMLRLGSRGARVRELQALLVRAGYTITVDGDFGPATRDAVIAFQGEQGLTRDGIAGPQTMRALERWRQAPEEQPGQLAPSQVPEVKDATKGGGLVVLLVAVRDSVADAAGGLLGLESATAQTLANGMLAAAGLIGAGLAVWAVLGVVRSRRTIEQ